MPSLPTFSTNFLLTTCCAGQHALKHGPWLFQLESHGVTVDNVGRDQWSDQALARTRLSAHRFVFSQPVVCEFDVVGGQFVAAVKLNALAQFRFVRNGVYLPHRFGDLRHCLALARLRHYAVIQIAYDCFSLALAMVRRIERQRVLRKADPDIGAQGAGC
jgi:hypothetical protein